MNKKLLGLCLILLICVVLVVSCSPDPIKKNKAIGSWIAVFEDAYGPDPGEDLTLTLTVTEGKFSIVLTVESQEDPVGSASGTWTASSVTEGEITVTESIDFATYMFDEGDKAGFAATDKKLYVDSADGVEAMVFTKK